MSIIRTSRPYVDLALHQQVVSGRALFLTDRFPVDRLPDRYIWGMSNRACTKVLTLAYAFTSSSVQPRLPAGCEEPLDAGQLLQYVRQSSGPPMRDRFVTVPSGVLKRLKVVKSTAADLPSFVNQPPRVSSIQAAQLGADEVVYTFQLSDPNGWQDLKTAYFLVRGKSDEAAGPPCYVKYNPSNHFLWNMRGDGGMGSQAVPGESTTLQGAGCTVDVAHVLVSAQGETMTLSLDTRLNAGLLQGPSVVGAVVEDLDEPHPGGRRSINHPSIPTRPPRHRRPIRLPIF